MGNAAAGAFGPPTQDIAEKHFTEHNDIFCDLINMAFYGGEPVIKPDELQDRPKRELIEKEKTLGELERDFLFLGKTSATF